MAGLSLWEWVIFSAVPAPPSPCIIAATRDTLRDLRGEVRRRADTIKNVPKDLCPDGKVTRHLANNPTLGLHPLVVVIDECQNLFANPVYGKEAGELATDIIKLGRALGIVLILATQRPTRTPCRPASLPTRPFGSACGSWGRSKTT